MSGRFLNAILRKPRSRRSRKASELKRPLLKQLCDTEAGTMVNNEVSECPRSSYILEERRTHLDTASWFWGNLSCGQAEYLLQDRKDGTFVVRVSSQSKKATQLGSQPLYCITYKLDGAVASLRVYAKDGELSLNFDDPAQARSATLHGLMAKLLNASKKYGAICLLERSRKAVPLKLTAPVNRLSSLKAHCRRVIRMTYSDDVLDAIWLPKHLKKFVLATS